MKQEPIHNKLAGDYKTDLSSNGKGLRLISLLSIDKYGGYSLWFIVTKGGKEIVRTQSLAQATRIYDSANGYDI